MALGRGPDGEDGGDERQSSQATQHAPAQDTRHSLNHCIHFFSHSYERWTAPLPSDKALNLEAGDNPTMRSIRMAENQIYLEPADRSRLDPHKLYAWAVDTSRWQVTHLQIGRMTYLAMIQGWKQCGKIGAWYRTYELFDGLHR